MPQTTARSLSRFAATAVVTAAVVAAGGSVAPAQRLTASAAAASRVVVHAVADADVRRDRPRRNFGGGKRLEIGGRHHARAYLRFSLPGSAALERAVLRVYVKRGSGRRLRVRTAKRRAWRERKVTFRSAPRARGRSAKSGRLTRKWSSIGVTALVRGRTRVTLVLSSRSRRPIELVSRNARTHGPRLVLHFRRGAGGAAPSGDGSQPAGSGSTPPAPTPSGPVNDTSPPTPVDPTCPRPYSDASPWNRAVGMSPMYNPQSTFFVSALQGELTSDPTQYTYPVYYVDSSTPLETVEMPNGWYSNVVDGGTRLDNRRMKGGSIQLPIPAGAAAAAGSDAQMILIDRSTGDEWGVSNLASTGSGGWTAYNAYHYNTQWTGVPPHDSEDRPFFARGAGVPYLAGLVRKCEIDRGYIDHALAFAYNFPTGEYVYPATKSDGDSPGPPDMPEGSRLQLDPTISEAEIRGWGCTGPCLTIAKALQTYGLYVIDNSGRPKVMLEYEGTANWNGLVGADTANPIPLNRFELVQPPSP